MNASDKYTKFIREVAFNIIYLQMNAYVTGNTGAQDILFAIGNIASCNNPTPSY